MWGWMYIFEDDFVYKGFYFLVVVGNFGVVVAESGAFRGSG